MTPVRWSTDYAAKVREALVDHVEHVDAVSATAARPPARRSAARLVVAFVIALALIVPASIFAFSRPTRQEPVNGAGVEAGQPLPGIALVGLWKVRATTEGDQTWVVIRAGGFTVERDRHVIEGAWLTAGDRVTASVAMWQGGLDPKLPWFTGAHSFAVQGDERVLLSASGSTLATLSPTTTAPNPIGAAADMMIPPTISPEERAYLTVPVLVPGAELTVTDLLGTWYTGSAEGRQRLPFLRFESDGTYSGLDGCNGFSGRWLLASGGQLAMTGGVQTQIGCDNAVDVLSWATGTRTASVLDGELALYNRNGVTLGTFRRDRGRSSTGVIEYNAFFGLRPLTQPKPSAAGSVLRPGYLVVRSPCAAVEASDFSDAGEQAALIAPTGSEVLQNGHLLNIEGVGTFPFGTRLPEVLVVRRAIPLAEQDPALRRCGTTKFIEVFPASAQP